MADKAREWTDKELARMENKIDKIYKQASKELNEKWDAYMKRGEERILTLNNAYHEAVRSGDRKSIDDAKNRLESAMKSFTLQNDQYKAMVESVTLDMAQVNQKALSYINDQLPNVYAENHDQIKTDLNAVKIDYTLADKGTVKRMIKDGDIKLPKKKISVPKDVAWNTKKINSSVLQGILQGEPLNKIADRLMPIMDNNRTSAIRNARTLVTGAESRGRIDSYHELADQGIILKKVWIATGDDHTRDAHLVMDGQEVDIDENFVDGDGNELEYPADPSGEPETVYNCRCTIRTHIIGVQNEDGTIDYIDYEHESGLHQEQIEAEIERRNQEEPTEPIELIEPQEVVIESDTDGAMRGVPKIQGDINTDDILKSVNTNYGHGREWSTNCANCSVATELQYRGYAVEAKPRDFSKENAIPRFWYDNKAGRGSWTDSFENMKGEEIGVRRKNAVADAITRKMQDYGDGSRGIIFVEWDGKTVGHYFNVVNEDGNVKFIDSQNSGKGVEKYFLKAKPSATRFWRTDDKEVTEYARKVVSWDESK